MAGFLFSISRTCARYTAQLSARWIIVRWMTRLFALLALVFSALLPMTCRALDRSELAVVINTLDPLSVAIGDYYVAKRTILFSNVIKVSFPPGEPALSPEEFQRVKADADSQTLPHVQAYALTWAAPYRVGCMSITSAFAFGYDPAYCASGCKPTRRSRYFDSPTRQPYSDLGIRPAMALAATSLDEAKALIDRGIASDGTHPSGTAYLLSTSDPLRDVRTGSYPMVQRMLKGRFRVRVLRHNALRDRKDVMFYFLGAARVPGLDTLRFLPGAIADHLTSAGGQLTAETGQMSALRWLEAGATGSFGTVVEPCNLPAKFPDPPVVIGHYLRGETLIEAYWKSVLMPGQGIFIGEPLAAPFGQPSAARP